MLSGRPKLLLADDSPTIQKVVSLTFGDEGMEVVTVGDGAGALRALADEPPPDLLLADVVMPGPDGYELCERVKRDGRLKHVPVVLLVGTFEPFNEAEARRVGADIVLTKPFQSIRDLVSKVGSLLGGGGPKGDEHARAEEEHAPPREQPAEMTSARAEASARFDADATTGPLDDEPGEPAGGGHATSFADLGADDELIEARPADAFGTVAGNAARRESVRATAFAREPDFHAAPRAEANGSAAHAAPGGSAWDVEEFAASVVEADDTGAVLTNQADESVMSEQNFPQTSFDAHAAEDDALLDLGQVNTPAAASAAEADDFVLDLDLEDETPPHRGADAGLDDLWAEPAHETQAPTSAWADAPSAFAEAAHGEPRSHFANAPAAVAEAPFDGQAALSAEPSPSFESAAPAADDRWRDVVMQDGPQGFAFGGEPQRAVAESPRGFVEPEVVPADEPVPASVEAEFTDGSVEGDVSKAPAPRAEAAHEVTPQEPSAAGFAVGAARAGLEEPVRAEQLSREAVDAIARRVVELMSDKVVREIAWEVVPELAELLIKQRLDEERRG